MRNFPFVYNEARCYSTPLQKKKPKQPKHHRTTFRDIIQKKIVHFLLLIDSMKDLKDEQIHNQSKQKKYRMNTILI